MDKLKESQALIKKLFHELGTSADEDYKLWLETEAYCIHNGLIQSREERVKAAYDNRKLRRGDTVSFILGSEPTVPYTVKNDEYQLLGESVVDLEGYSGEVSVKYLKRYPNAK